MTIKSDKAVANCKNKQYAINSVAGNLCETQAPGGYKFFLIDEPEPDVGKIVMLCLLSWLKIQ